MLWAMGLGACLSAGMAVTASASAAPAAPAAASGTGAFLQQLKECKTRGGLRAVACVGSRGTGKSTLLDRLFEGCSGLGDGGAAGFRGQVLAENNIALMEADTGSGESAAVAAADLVLYNVLKQDAIRSPRTVAEALRPSLELAAREHDGRPCQLRVVVRDCLDGDASLLGVLQEELSRVIKEAGAEGVFGVDEVTMDLVPHSAFGGASFSRALSSLRAAVIQAAVGEDEEQEEHSTSAESLIQRLKSATLGDAPGDKGVDVHSTAIAYVAADAVAKCLKSFDDVIQRISVPDDEFGHRADFTIEEILSVYDDVTRAKVTAPGSAGIVARKRDELRNAMVIGLGKVHALQVEHAKEVALEKFGEKVSSIRSVGGVTKDLDDAIVEADKGFTEAVASLNGKLASWPSNKARTEMLREMREIASDRQQMALLQKGLGAAKPRKAISVGMHTFVEQAFAKDSRFSPSTVDTGHAGWSPYKGKEQAEQLLFDLSPPEKAVLEGKGIEVKADYLERAKQRVQRAKRIVLERQVEILRPGQKRQDD
jgi:hypothetical protein